MYGLGQLIRPELARAWENYFGLKGGATPQLASEVLGVVVLDHDPPWVPYRIWHAGILGTAGAGNYNYIAISNRDANKETSVCIVDHIAVKNITVAAEIVIGLGNTSLAPGIAYGETADADSGKEPSTTGTDPGFFNVGIGSGQNATAGLIRSQYPAPAVGAYVVIPGPFILRPQGELLITANALAAQIHAYFRGRFYPSL
jgi:hypothetical protein